MRTFKLLLPVVLLVVCVLTLHADTILVPSQQPTIQAGINAAVDGDTVLVADGVYTGDGNRDIDFLRKAIVVMSENGAENCVIDCEASYGDKHRGFYFNGEADSSSVVQGFTITNGYFSAGGGIIISNNTTATIIGNIIKGNRVWNYGGGIACDNNSSPTIEGNTISGNEAGEGGGIGCYNNSSPTIEGNTISGNTGDYIGGGIYCRYNSSPIITNNTISGNRVDDWGGGGIDCSYSSSPIVIGNTITHNRGGYGGGIRCSNDSFLTSTGNTITGNIALEWGGGIACSDQSSTLIVNTILWDNNASEGNEMWIGGYNAPSIVTIGYSEVEGGSTAVFISYGSTIHWGNGMIDDDPLFVDPDNDDYRLLAGSPCIDAGDPDMPCVPWGGWWLDMGAYEYDQGFYFDGQNLILKPFPVVFSDER